MFDYNFYKRCNNIEYEIKNDGFIKIYKIFIINRNFDIDSFSIKLMTFIIPVN